MTETYFAADFYDSLSAWSTFGGAVGTVVTVVVTGVVAIRTLQASKRDSRDRSRPMVGALLERDTHPSGRTLHLAVRSYGQSVAYDVKVTFDPPIEATGTSSGQHSFVPLLLSRYANPIPNLMPGVELRSLWYAPGKEVDGRLQNDEPIPDRVTATITYADRPSTEPNPVVYEDTFVLDTQVMFGEVIVTHSDDHLGLHKKTTKAMETIAPAITQVANDIHRIEGYVKPDEVREREAAELEESRRNAASIREQLLGRRAQLTGASEGEPDVENTPDADPSPEPVSEGAH